jgi:fatty acid desaturase
MSVLLLGASLAGLVWVGKPFAIVPLLCGFILRWILYVDEVKEIRNLDRLKVGLPPASARIRLAITYITGAFIPLLVLKGVPPFIPLVIAFLLTALSQWSAACEQLYREIPKTDCEPSDV